MLFLLLLAIALAWFIGTRIYEKYWAKGLSVRLSFEDRAICEGESSVLRETVANDKLLPLPALEVRFAADRALEFTGDSSANSSASDQRYRRDVFSFLFRQQASRTLSFTAGRRGVYEITGCSVVGYDYLFHSGYYMDLPQETRLYVYPRQIDARRISLITRAISGELLSRSRLYPDPFAFSGIREYRRDDPMRHINWKASARAGELMVNQFDSTTSITLSLLFDIEDSHILKSDSLIEETIRITASLAARLAESRMAVRVMGNAIDPETGDALSLSQNAGMGNADALRRKLACVDASKTACTSPELIAAAQKGLSPDPSLHTCIVISKNQDAGLEDALVSLCQTGAAVLWVVPMLPSDSAASRPSPSRGLQVLPWPAL